MKQINDDCIIELNIWLQDQYGKKFQDVPPSSLQLKSVARECVDFLNSKGAGRLSSRLSIHWVKGRGIVVKYGK